MLNSYKIFLFDSFELKEIDVDFNDDVDFGI